MAFFETMDTSLATSLSSRPLRNSIAITHSILVDVQIQNEEYMNIFENPGNQFISNAGVE